MVPGKGYDLLIAALVALADMPWRLTIAGDRTRNPAAAAQLDADIEAYGLGDRVAVLGAVPAERIIELYLASDIFVLASRFEGYGMALPEAIGHGLPVVSTKAGAIPETVPAEAGLLVAPDDTVALAQALRRLIGDPPERRRLATNARAAAAQLPTWQDSAQLFASAIETVMSGGTKVQLPGRHRTIDFVSACPVRLDAVEKVFFDLPTKFFRAAGAFCAPRR